MTADALLMQEALAKAREAWAKLQLERARLFREERRGWKAPASNLDVLLAAFAKAELARRDADEAARFERLANTYVQNRNLHPVYVEEAKRLRARIPTS